MHPIGYEQDYAIDRNRLTTFFRLIVAIPWIIIGYVYQLIAALAAILAWFAMLFTGRYPESLYDFNAGYIRFQARVGGFILLATDEFPPFWGTVEPNYPIRVDVAPRQLEYSRAKTFFKLLLAFPQIVIQYGLQLVVGGAAFIAWFRILVTGKQSATMHDALRVGLAYYTRSSAFIALLTEVHPRLLDLAPQEIPLDAPSMPPVDAGSAYGQLAPQAQADPYATPQAPPPPPPPPPAA